MTKFKISVEETAKILGKKASYIRIGLQQKRLPFGVAVETGKGRWSYHISPARLSEYIGKDADECLREMQA